jgi:hypothetical protein
MDPIADRRLELRIQSESIEVIVSLGRPQQVGPDEWKCEYEVKFGGSGTIRATHGGDSLQALQLSMVSIDGELERGAQRRGGQLFHLGEPFNSILENSGMQPRMSADSLNQDAT